MSFHTITIGILGFLVAGCSSSIVETYAVRLHVSEAKKVSILQESIERVMERKLSSQNIQGATVTVIPSERGMANVRFTLPNAVAADFIRETVARPFTFDLRVEKVAAPDPTNVKNAVWIPANLTGSSVMWAQATGDRSTGTIALRFELSDEGKKRFASIVEKARGKAIGIFINDILMSKMIVEGKGAPGDIVINGVPSPAIAEIVMDDVNVGLLTSFELPSK